MIDVLEELARKRVPFPKPLQTGSGSRKGYKYSHNRWSSSSQFQIDPQQQTSVRRRLSIAGKPSSAVRALAGTSTGLQDTALPKADSSRAMSHHDGVQVQVGVISEQGTKKSPATLDEVQAASAGAASACCNSSKCSACPSNCMWGLFLVGWLFPPAWWAGTFKGLRCGKDDEYFIKRREGTPTIAWAANLLMSLVSAVVLILVLAIIFGRPGPQQEGPYFIAVAGTSDVLPDFNDPANLNRLAQAVHGGLALPATYPVSRISMFLESSTATPDNTPARRRLLQVADNTVEVAVLGYTMERTPELPASDTLAALINDGTATDFVSTNLVSVGLIKPENVGKLQLGLLPAVPREKLAEVLANKDNKDKPAFSLVPVGKRCKGEWTEWTACAGCGNRTRTFIIPPGVEDAAPQVTTSATGAAEALNATRRLQAASSNAKGNSNGKGKARPVPSGRPSTIGASTHGQQSQGHGLAQALGLGHAMQGLALGKVECAVLNNTVETQACTDTCPGYCAGVPESATGNVTFVWQCGSGNHNGTSCAGTCSQRPPQADNPIFGIADSLCSNGTYQSPSQNCTDV